MIELPLPPWVNAGQRSWPPNLPYTLRGTPTASPSYTVHLRTLLTLLTKWSGMASLVGSLVLSLTTTVQTDQYRQL